MQVKDIIKHLTNNYNPEDHVANIIWCIGDIDEHITDEFLTQDDKNEIIDRMSHNHDCSYGITWDTLQAEVDAYVLGRG